MKPKVTREYFFIGQSGVPVKCKNRREANKMATEEAKRAKTKNAR